MQSRHISVLLPEVLELLKTAEGGDFLDCTLGGGGHTAGILAANPSNRVWAFDRDKRACTRAQIRFEADSVSKKENEG